MFSTGKPSSVRGSPVPGTGFSPHYIPIPGSRWDTDVAPLFAEVVTCYELDPTGTTRQLDEAT